MSTSPCNKSQLARRIALLCLLALLGLSLGTGDFAVAQASAHYNLEWHVIAGGGQPVSSTSYRVNGTVGQGVASPPLITSANYHLSVGYWFRGIVPWRLYLPLVMRSS